MCKDDELFITAPTFDNLIFADEFENVEKDGIIVRNADKADKNFLKQKVSEVVDEIISSDKYKDLKNVQINLAGEKIFDIKLDKNKIIEQIGQYFLCKYIKMLEIKDPRLLTLYPITDDIEISTNYFLQTLEEKLNDSVIELIRESEFIVKEFDQRLKDYKISPKEVGKYILKDSKEKICKRLDANERGGSKKKTSSFILDEIELIFDSTKESFFGLRKKLEKPRFNVNTLSDNEKSLYNEIKHYINLDKIIQYLMEKKPTKFTSNIAKKSIIDLKKKSEKKGFNINILSEYEKALFNGIKDYFENNVNDKDIQYDEVFQHLDKTNLNIFTCKLLAFEYGIEISGDNLYRQIRDFK